jgi:predicted GH43/DUF377 family glycosyl hydrolase
MKWVKKGFLVDSNSFEIDWYKKNTMVPVPHLVSDSLLRLYVAMCDENNVGRIGYIDVNPNNPSEIIGYSKIPVLDIGEDGCFDDSGVIPSAIYEENGKTYMLYSAYQKQTKVPYTSLSGLAEISADKKTMKRIKITPLLERTEGELFIRSAAFCIKEGGTYKIYYSSGLGWTENKIKEVPKYNIKLLESDNLLKWHSSIPKVCLKLEEDEYGLTAPNIYKNKGLYHMFYSVRSISKGYRMGYATSSNSYDWERLDSKIGLNVSPEGWDSDMVCFGNIFKYNEKTYLFYCGNHYGIGGMGYAQLVEE